MYTTTFLQLSVYSVIYGIFCILIDFDIISTVYFADRLGTLCIWHFAAAVFHIAYNIVSSAAPVTYHKHLFNAALCKLIFFLSKIKPVK